MPPTSSRERAAHLSDLYKFLYQLQYFSDEDERMHWRWRLHQLQRHHEKDQQDVWAASLLTAIESQILALPIESTQSKHLSRMRASSASAVVGEYHLSVDESNDQRKSDFDTPPSRGSVPLMENNTLATANETQQYWNQMSGVVQAASGRTMRALTRSSVRDRGQSMPLTPIRMSMSDDADVRNERNLNQISLAIAALSRSHETDSAQGGTERDLSLTLAALRRQEECNSFRHSVPNLVQSIVSYLGLSMTGTFLCQICYDYVPVNASYALMVCGHMFCEACLQSYLEFKIKEGQVYPKCFFELSEDRIPCNAQISIDDIQSLVPQRVWQKYTTFKFNKEHELARQCPYCDHTQIYAGSDHPECKCEACNQEFCFVHSSAHQGKTCAAYDKNMIAVEKLNSALISKISRPCPGCQNNVEKTGGWNQMKCVICSTSFCWICLKVIDDSVFPEHFQWWNVRGCAGNQMVDNEGQSATQKGIIMVMRILFFVIFGPPALVITVVFCILCCCFYPCSSDDSVSFRQAFTTCFCVSGYILLAPLVLVLGLVALAVFLGGAAAGAAVLVCISPIIVVMLLVRRDAGRPMLSLRQSSSRSSDHAKTATACVFEDINDSSSPYDQMALHVSKE